MFIALLATGKIPYSITRNFPILLNSADRLFEIAVEINVDGRTINFKKKVFCRHNLSFSAAEMEIRKWEWDSSVINYETENSEGLVIRLPDARKKCSKDNKVFAIWREGGIEKIGWLDKYTNPEEIEIYEFYRYASQTKKVAYEGGHVEPKSIRVSFQSLSDIKSILSTSAADFRRNQSWFDDRRGFGFRGSYKEYLGMNAFLIPFNSWRENKIIQQAIQQDSISGSMNFSGHLNGLYDKVEDKGGVLNNLYSLTRKGRKLISHLL